MNENEKENTIEELNEVKRWEGLFSEGYQGGVKQVNNIKEMVQLRKKIIQQVKDKLEGLKYYLGEGKKGSEIGSLGSSIFITDEIEEGSRKIAEIFNNYENTQCIVIMGPDLMYKPETDSWEVTDWLIHSLNWRETNISV